MMTLEKPDEQKPHKPKPAKHKTGPTRLSTPARAVRGLSLAYLGLTIAATVVLWSDWGNEWWGTLLRFLPHHPFLIVPAALLVGSLFIHRRSFVINLTCLACIVGPLMGFRLPLWNLVFGKPVEPGLLVVSCNVQQFEPDFRSLLEEITVLQPDVVALQEALAENELLNRSFPGWHAVHEGEFWVLSRFPVTRLDTCHSVPFQRETALSVRIDAPSGSFVLHNLHLTTVRHGLSLLNVDSIVDGSGPFELEQQSQWREIEAEETRAYVEKIGYEQPILVLGDFNTPTYGRGYRASWSDFTNAFDEAGFGFGYTAPCVRRRFWPDYQPWVRIDHILSDPRWSVSECDVGWGNGSDHRLIWARLVPQAH